MSYLFPYILIKTWQHLQLTFSAMFIASIIAIPLGIFLARKCSEKFSSAIIRFVSILQTIPGLALIALVVVVLVFLYPFTSLPTTGFLPGVIVLSIYALLPLLSNSYIGIQKVNPTMLEVAKGMGMNSSQSLYFVEIPLALPVIIMGFRIALIWTISCATLTALIGSGGLGDLIMQGLRSMQIEVILAGTIPAALLAIILDFIVSLLGKWLSRELV